MTKSDDKRVPALRFKGFTDEWEQRKLSTFVKRINLSSSAKIPNVNYEDISSNNGILNKKVSELSTGKKGIKFDKDDILFGKLRPYLNNYIITNFSGIAVGDFWVLRSLESSTFLFYLIQTPKFKYISNISSGSKMPRSDWNLVSNFHFNIPHNTEQSNIGKLLQLINNCITLQQRKLKLEENLKKAIMQRTFSKKDSFKHVKLRQIAQFQKGNNIKKSDLLTNGQYKVVHYADLYKYAPIQKRVLHYTNKAMGTRIPENSLLFPESDVTPIGLARTSFLKELNAYAGGDVIIATIISKNVNTGFLSYEINYFKNLLIPLITGTTVRHIHIDDLKKLDIFLPNKPKQDKIYTILFSQDRIMDYLKTKTFQLKELKHFLLQNMFI